jgi:hypothetical protein
VPLANMETGKPILLRDYRRLPPPEKKRIGGRNYLTAPYRHLWLLRSKCMRGPSQTSATGVGGFLPPCRLWAPWWEQVLDLRGWRYFVNRWVSSFDRSGRARINKLPSLFAQIGPYVASCVSAGTGDGSRCELEFYHNQKVRKVIDTITSKAVLILGRFTHERKKVLDALREELRKHNYLPILFDFSVPATRDITETVSLLARMARFIIADLTDPSSIPQELQAIIPSVRVPVQPLLLEGSSLYSMFKDFDPQDFHWVLPVYRYKEPEQLLATLAENVIAPAERKAKALEEGRRRFEAELTKPQ